MPETNQSPETTTCPCCQEKLELNLELVTEPGNQPAVPKHINLRFVHPTSGGVQMRRYTLDEVNG